MYILHRPCLEIFQSLDELLLLRIDKKHILQKQQIQSVFLENEGFSVPKQCNPADVFMDIISGQS